MTTKVSLQMPMKGVPVICDVCSTDEWQVGILFHEGRKAHIAVCVGCMAEYIRQLTGWGVPNLLKYWRAVGAVPRAGKWGSRNDRAARRRRAANRGKE